MLVGYARVFTQDQNANLQTDALKNTRCEIIFTEKASEAYRDRLELKAVLEYIRAGDVLVAWNLDRLGPEEKRWQTCGATEKRHSGLQSAAGRSDHYG